jgi:hypothetical protein
MPRRVFSCVHALNLHWTRGDTVHIAYQVCSGGPSRPMVTEAATETEISSLSDALVPSLGPVPSSAMSTLSLEQLRNIAKVSCSQRCMDTMKWREGPLRPMSLWGLPDCMCSPVSSVGM